MNKLILSTIAAVIAIAAAVPASAAVATDTFDVSVTLTSACRLSTPPGDIALTYTSFSASAQSQTTDFGVECTNTLPYTMSLSAANADQLGLSIGLALRNSGDTADVTGTQTAGTSAAAYKIKASIAAGQTGTCATATCTSSVTRTLTVTY